MTSQLDATSPVAPDSVTLSFREISVSGEELAAIDFHASLVVLGGYAARDAVERQNHIDELRNIGIEAPEDVPAFWAVGRHLLTTGGRIEVQGDRTSGEIEYALLFHEGRVLVAAASDQTDREFEVRSIPRSKQMCAKVLSRRVVALADLLSGWDDIELYSDVRESDGDWRPYQRTTLTALMTPDDLIAACFGERPVPDGTVLLSGTVSLVDGVTRYWPHFRGGMHLPGSDADLSVDYAVDVLPDLPYADADVR